MDPDHIDITLHRADCLDAMPPDRILADLEEPELAIRETTSRPAEILGQTMAFVFHTGMHPLDVARRGFRWLLNLESSTVTFKILNSHAPAILAGTPDDICNAIRLRDIPDAHTAATIALQTAIDRRLIKIPTPEGPGTLPVYDGIALSEAQEIGEFIVAAGGDVCPVVRRWYILAKSWYPHHIGTAALQVLANLSGESRQAWQTRCDAVNGKIIEATGGISHGAGYRATDSHRENCSEAGKIAWQRKKQLPDPSEDPPAIG